jgi:hypothetical protein
MLRFCFLEPGCDTMIEGYTTEEVIECYADYIKDGKPIGVLVS